MRPLLAAAVLAALVDPACQCAQPAGEGEAAGEGEGEAAGEGEGASAGEGEGASAGEGEGEGAVCAPYQLFCAGVGCVNDTVDPDHCGGCDAAHVCSDTQVCAGGACVDGASGCLGNTQACHRACVDFNSDNAHCGGCDNAVCDTGTGCSGGACVTTVPLTPLPAGTCANGGPPISVPTTSGGSVCTGNLAQVSFTFGLCSCGDVQSSSTVVIDAFNSLAGPYVAGDPGGGLGADGKIQSSTVIAISGTMWTSDTSGLSSSGTTNVGEELHVNGPVSSSGLMNVGANAFINGDIDVGRGIDVVGTAFVPTGSQQNGLTAASVVEEASVDVPDPCDCAAADLIPITAIVESFRNNNDDAAVNLDPNALANPGAPSRVDLECGAYFFNDINSSTAITIFAHGNVAIFVAGDVHGSAPITFALDPDASLDIFVEGTLNTSQTVSLGNPAYPALTRLYVGSQNGIGLSSSLDVGGFIYALGQVQSSGAKDVFGGIFAGSYGSSADTNIHYDAAVLSAGAACTGAGGEGEGEGGEGEGEGSAQCTSCRDCANQACVNGTCGACSTSADCCSPLLCVNGTCELFGG